MKNPSKEAVRAADNIIDSADFEGAQINRKKLALLIDEAFKKRINAFIELRIAAKFIARNQPTTPRFIKALAECDDYMP